MGQKTKSDRRVFAEAVQISGNRASYERSNTVELGKYLRRQ
jgi:hypothetical protein